MQTEVPVMGAAADDDSDQHRLQQQLAEAQAAYNRAKAKLDQARLQRKQ